MPKGNNIKFGIGVDVVTAARQRIKNIFSNNIPVVLSFSGGKDSLCLDHLVYSMCESGEIDKSLLRVIFIDEEGIYPCVERIVKQHRIKWLLAGVPFDWYAMEYKHFNCLNSLMQDETFVCFDSTKKDKWIRTPPDFAIRDHPLLIKRQDSYQTWCAKAFKDCIDMIAVRASESLQRRNYMFDTTIEKNKKAYPVYDWTDKDVWKYIYDNNIEIPDAYLYMYQCGIYKKQLRLSQFFSVDTVGALVKMCEFYPGLFEKVCKREPNAYMAMLYFDTELFRRQKKNSETVEIDYKEKVMDIITNPVKYNIDMNKAVNIYLKRIIIQKLCFFTKKEWKMAYQIYIAGDPKRRTQRALATQLELNRAKGV